MITEYRSISLCYLSTNLSLLAHLETIGTIYQRKPDTYHLVLSDVDFGAVNDFSSASELNLSSTNKAKNLIWLEISPYRVIMTQQNQQDLNYRHFWEKGVYGISYYWLNQKLAPKNNHNKIQLRNFTRDFTCTGSKIPESVRIEYELWTNQLNLGNYILHLEIK